MGDCSQAGGDTADFPGKSVNKVFPWAMLILQCIRRPFLIAQQFWMENIN